MFKKKSHKEQPKSKNAPIRDFVENAPNKKGLVGEDSRQTQLKSIAKDPKTTQAIGVVLFLIALFAFMSYLSYWFNVFSHRSDQALVVGKSWKWYQLNQEILANNMMGYLGARISFLLCYKLFGMASILLIVALANQALILIGVRSFFKIQSVFKQGIFIMLWTSLFLGFITADNTSYLGGGMGYFGSQWFNNVLGWPGTLLLLFFTLALFIILEFNLNIASQFQRVSQKKEPHSSTHQPLTSDQDDTEAHAQKHSEESSQTETLVLEDLPISNTSQSESNTVDNSADDPADETQKLELQVIDLGPNETVPEQNNPNNEPSSEHTISKHNSENPAKPENTDIPFQIETQPPPSTEGEDTHQPASKPTKHVGLDEPYDPHLDLPAYQYPLDSLLKDYDIAKAQINREDLENSKNLIVETLKNYNIGIAEIKATIGPTVTLYEIIPVSGVRISKIKNLEDDIALSLSALGIRIIAPIPGKGTIGIEVPNKKPEMVPMSAVIRNKKFKESNFELPVILGKTISNEIYIADLAKMPHLLVAGATGQGKSVGLNCLIISLLYKKHPTELKFVLVDPKKVELSLYNKLEKHFLAKLPGDGDAIITDTNVVKDTLNSLCVEMDIRYDLLKEAGCRNIIEYNNKFKSRRLNPDKGHRFLPYIVAIIDEVADLMMTAGREVETPIARLAQLARAVGIHVILATQRPSVNIITGTIKANFPARIAFRVSSKIDSRTILDNNGADQLIGKGDMLYYSGNELIRLQCPFVDTPEADSVVDFIAEQRNLGGAFVLPEAPGEESSGLSGLDEDKDELFDEAARIVVETQQGSTSMIQRKLKIGYNRAGRLIDQLEAAGVVGPGKGSKARDVLIHDLDSLEQFLSQM